MAAAITEYINAYFKGGQHNRSASGPSCRSTSQRHVPTFKSFVVIPFARPSSSRCLVKITGDLTMSFPAGITRILAATPSVPVLSFRLLSISRINHFLPNQKLLYRSADVCPLIMGCVSSVLASPPCLSVCPSVRPATRLRVTRTPGTSGSTCRLCSSTCREKLSSTLRPPTTTSV